MATDASSIIKPKVKIKVLGIGGGGNNVLMRIGQERDLDIELIAVNTDRKQLQVLESCGINCIQIGEAITRGRGTGGRVQLGEEAAINEADKLKAVIGDADLVFITAGMGGGTGTGAAPVAAKIAKEAGVLSIGVVTTPFSFEGGRKKRTAIEGITKMQSKMDALIVVENDNLLLLPENKRMLLTQAFQTADKVLEQAISCIAELILTTGVINVDFADLKTIFKQSDSSDAMLGIGTSKHGAVEAVKAAIAMPLVKREILGARGVILNLTGDDSMSLYDVDEAMNYMVEKTDPEVNVIMGTVEDDNMDGEIRATLIATDFIDSEIKKTPAIKVPESKVKKDAFQLSTPNFMNKKLPADNNGIGSGKVFAIPAFKITDGQEK